MNKNRSLDIRQEERKELFNMAMQAALSGEDDEKAQDAFFNYFETIQENVMNEAKAMIQSKDSQILAARGNRSLTSEERDYYNEVIQALDTNDPKQAISGVEKAIPTTIFDTVFENLRQEYPLLKHVDLIYVKDNVRIVYSKTGPKKATWGKLCVTNTNELSGEVDYMEAGKNALTAYVYLCRDMLKLGPEWLDRYVREILKDALAYGLEDGFVNGSGIDSPIGMVRNIESALDPTDGLRKKDAVELDSFSIEDFGAVLTVLKADATGRRRRIGVPFFAYNPADETKILAARKVLSSSGYVDVVPYAIDFVESVSVEEGEAIVGVSKAYLGIVTGDSEGEIEYSDEYRFLEGNRTYSIRLRGNGTPKDNSSFVRVDISNIKPFTPIGGFSPTLPIEVEIVNKTAIPVVGEVEIVNDDPIAITGEVNVDVLNQPIEVFTVVDDQNNGG